MNMTMMKSILKWLYGVRKLTHGLQLSGGRVRQKVKKLVFTKTINFTELSSTVSLRLSVVQILDLLLNYIKLLKFTFQLA